MELIDILVIVFGAVAAISKSIDCITTIRGYNRAKAAGMYNPIGLEQNPIGRRLFRRFGVVGGCWLTFAFMALVISFVCACTVLGDYGGTSKCAVMALCALLTWGNISAGILNTTGRRTLLVKIMLVFYSKLGKLRR